MFDEKYAEDVTISSKFRIGTDLDLAFEFNRDNIPRDIRCRGWGWPDVFVRNELFDPIKKYVDEQKRVVLDFEVIDFDKFYFKCFRVTCSIPSLAHLREN